MNHIRPFFLKLAFTASILFWASIAVTTATAATFNFTGTVTNVGSNLISLPTPEPFGAKPSLSGSYTFNPLTPNTGDATVGLYFGTVSNVSFQLGTYTGTNGLTTPTAVPKFIGVTNNAFLIGDAYLVAAKFAGGTVNGRSPVAFEIDLSGGTSGFGSSALPATPPSLSAFVNPDTFRVIFNGGGSLGNRTVLGTLTSLTAVPLPAAVILFGVGLIALVGLGAGSWRHRKSSLA